MENRSGDFHFGDDNGLKAGFRANWFCPHKDAMAGRGFSAYGLHHSKPAFRRASV
jgi:hypothetical protein